MPEVNLGKVVGPKGSDGAQGPAGADGLSAYEQAQAGGYSGSELEFNQQLAGLSDGPFVPESDKGVASGVATLDSTGKVPSGQLPSMNYIPTSQKGAASGVASLDATGKLEETQKPDYTASEVGAVPTTRTVNGKSLSADVVLTGEDIKTSASDETTISSQLSNRLLKSGDTMMGDLLLGAPTMGTHGAIGAFVNDDSAVTFIDAFDASRDNGSRVQLVTNRADVNSCFIQLLKRVDGEFILLGKLALATPPQVFALPLADGITALQPCTYWKNQFGEVTIGGCVANGISDNITIATLPDGFRPAKAMERPATLSGGGARYEGSVLIGTDGSIRIRTSATTNAVVFGATFIGAN